MKPLQLDIAGLKMLPKDLVGQSCSICGKCQSVWHINLPAKDPVVLCSLCLLYGTPWGKAHAEQLRDFIEGVSAERKEPVVWDEQGRLDRVKADAVAGSLLFTTKLFALRDAEKQIR